MIRLKKNGRDVAAMVMNESVNQIFGVVQCMNPGCQAYMPLRDEGESAKSQILWFLENHDCNPKRFPTGRRGRVSKLNGPVS